MFLRLAFPFYQPEADFIVSKNFPMHPKKSPASQNPIFIAPVFESMKSKASKTKNPKGTAHKRVSYLLEIKSPLSCLSFFPYNRKSVCAFSYPCYNFNCFYFFWRAKIYICALVISRFYLALQNLIN